MLTFFGVPAISSGLRLNQAISAPRRGATRSNLRGGIFSAWRSSFPPFRFGGGLRPPSGPPPRLCAGGAGAGTDAERFFQRGDEVSYLFYQSGGGGVLLDFSDDRGAHRHAVGRRGDGGDLVGCGDAEADADGLGREQAQGADLGVEGLWQVAALAGE